MRALLLCLGLFSGFASVQRGFVLSRVEAAGVEFIDDNGVGPGVASRKLVACREIVLHLTLWQIWL